MKTFRFHLLITVLIFSCKTNYTELPILNYTINPATGEKNFYSISHNNFITQFGNEFHDNTVKNKVYLVNFFFTKCPSICPPMMSNLLRVSNNFDTEEFYILSFTIDPQNDTKKVLYEYWINLTESKQNWFFLNSSVENTKNIAKSYLTNFKKRGQEKADYLHSSQIALIDTQGRIRGLYNSLEEKDIECLMKDIKVLIK